MKWFAKEEKKKKIEEFTQFEKGIAKDMFIKFYVLE